MSEEVNKEQTKGAEQENITELTDQQLAEAQGGAATRTQSSVRSHEEAAVLVDGNLPVTADEQSDQGVGGEGGSLSI